MEYLMKRRKKAGNEPLEWPDLSKYLETRLSDRHVCGYCGKEITDKPTYLALTYDNDVTNICSICKAKQRKH